MYWTCVNIGSMNHAGPQHAGGVFVDMEHKINTVMQVSTFLPRANACLSLSLTSRILVP